MEDFMPEAPNMTEVNELLGRASEAAAIFSQLSQKQTDSIVKAVCDAAFAARVRLAKMAVEETGIGRWEDKVIKNVVATQFVYEDMKNLKTAGVIAEDFQTGITEIAHPIGPVLGVIPTTNPTSTTIFKILICLKTRNPIILSFHPRAVKCCTEAARICYDAAVRADAPEFCVQWMKSVSLETTNAIMRDKRLSLILATGGESLVHAAYSSGTPALGVGPGNVPVLIDKSADIPFAAEQILISKLFDNGTICASEQAVIVEKVIEDKMIEEFTKRGAYFAAEDELKALEDACYNREKGLMSADIVGKPASFIAKKAGLKAPADVKLIMAKQTKIGRDYPLSCEILAPVLAWYSADSFDHAVNLCVDLNFMGGKGHTASIYCNDEERIVEFANIMNAGRIVVNTPSAQGAVGGIYNSLHASFTLGCGTDGKNITTDNITARNLLNIQRIARRRVNQRLEKFDTALYYNESLSFDRVVKEFNKNI
jgi:acetaldehyde dehydrogenase/alcohol dehydrogenase